MLIFFKRPDVNDLIKAVIKKTVWISGYTKPDGTYVRPHSTTVNASTDHDDHKVASGQGKGYQVHAHKHLSKQAEHNALPVEQQSNHILHLATKMQKEASAKSDINTLKNKIIDGKKPTVGEWKALLGATNEKIESVIKQIKEAGKLDFYTELAADHVEKHGAAKVDDKEEKPEPIEKVDEKPASESSNDQAKPEENKIDPDNLVLNEGNGIVINKLYKQFGKIKTDTQNEKWLDAVKKTTFGTYGNLPFLEVLEKFNPKFKNEIEKDGFINGVKKALGLKVAKPSLKDIQDSYNADKEKVIGDTSKDIEEKPVKNESPRHAKALKEIAGLPSGNYKKQAHSELSAHSDWDSWGDKEKHDKVMALYKEKQSAATAASNVVKFKKTVKSGGIPTPAQMSAVMVLADEKRSTLLSELANEVGGTDKLKEILAKADEKAKKAGVAYESDKKQEETAPVTSPVDAEADSGPKDGDTKEGADGTLVLKDGHWHKQGESESKEKSVTDKPVSEANEEEPAGWEVKQFNHSKTGKELHAVQIPSKVDKDTYNQIKALAKEHGGYWSGYNKDGAIKGFLFDDAGDASAFAKKAPALSGVGEPDKPVIVDTQEPEKKDRSVTDKINAGLVKLVNDSEISSDAYSDALLYLNDNPDDLDGAAEYLENQGYLSSAGKIYILASKLNLPLKDNPEPVSSEKPTNAEIKDKITGLHLNEGIIGMVQAKIAFKYLDDHPGDLLGAAKIVESAGWPNSAWELHKLADELGITKENSNQGEPEKSIDDLIKEAGSQAVAEDVAEAYFAKHGESVETYDAVLTALDMQGYGKLANDFYAAMPEGLKELSSMKPVNQEKSAQAPIGTEAVMDGVKYIKEDGNWKNLSTGNLATPNGNIPAALELISGHTPSDAWFNAKSDNHKESVAEIASENGVPVGDALSKVFPTGDNGPKAGDTKVINGVTYVLKDGRWHKVGQDEKKADSVKDAIDAVPVPEFSSLTQGQKNTIAKALDSLKNNIANDGAAAFKGVITKSKVKGKLNFKFKSNYEAGFYGTSWASYVDYDENGEPTNFGETSNGKFSKEAYDYIEALKAAHNKFAGKKPAKKKAVKKETVAEPVKAKVYKQNPEVKHLSLADVLGASGESIDNWTQDGGKMGSNEGGLYTDGTGQQWYCKFPASEDHVKNEILASKLYEALGIKTATVKEINLNGKMGIASKIIDGLKIDKKALKKSDDMLSGFGADCWLGNWDVVGLNYDNALIDQNGSVYRIDPGGALLYRAQGEPKGDKFGRYVTELDTLLDASKNSQSAAIFGDMTHEQLSDSVRSVLLLKDSAIEKLCSVYGPGNAEDRSALANKLISRKHDLAKKFPEAAKEAMPKMTYTLSAAPNFKEWNGPGQGLSSKKHLNDQNQDLANQMHDLASEKKLDELTGFEFQPLSYESGEPVGGMQPIEMHKSKHVVNYWHDLINDLKSPKMSVDHLKDVVLSTVGGTFGKIISLLDDVEKLTEAAVKIGRYALMGTIDGDPFTGWAVKELSKKNGAINSQELYDETQKKWKNLSNLEQQAIKQYTGPGYDTMNDPTTGVGSHSNTDFAIAGFEKMSVPVKPGTVLSRRHGFKSPDDLKKFLDSEGGIVKDFGMISSSLNPDFWHGKVHLRIICGEGVKAAFVDKNPSTGGGAISSNPGEDEVVFPYGTKFFVRKVYAKDKKFTDEHGYWGGKDSDYVVEVVALPNT